MANIHLITKVSLCTIISHTGRAKTMERVAAQEARRHFARLLGKVAYGNETAIITRNGVDHAVMMSIKEFERLSELEDLLDNIMADKALAEGTISWEEFKAEHGL